MKDVPKTIWGSSTRVLDQARTNAITKTYDKGYWDCIKAATSVIEKKYVLFKKDEVEGVMIVMGIPGAVNTTEVGVFFVEVNDHQTRLELSSLSTNAKRLLAKGLFHGMDVFFGYAPPDQEEGFSTAEFKDRKTPEVLIKVIEDDGFTVPSVGDPIQSLNEFLANASFYESWSAKHKESLPKEALDLIAVKEKSVDQIKRLNRLILETSYPTVCPISAGDEGAVNESIKK
jgi:hypothetical protein